MREQGYDSRTSTVKRPLPGSDASAKMPAFMCGIFGLISFEPVAPRLVAAADRLLSRGEHSTGAATYDGAFFRDHAGLGPASTVFHNYDLSQLSGAIGIVHTRYATTGGGTKELLLRNRQPV